MMWRATTGRRPRWWWAGLVELVALMPVLPGLAASLGTSDATMAVPGEVLVTDPRRLVAGERDPLPHYAHRQGLRP